MRQETHGSAAHLAQNIRESITEMLPGTTAAPKSGNAVQIQYQIASTRADREAAFELVHQSYSTCGLGEANAHGLRITPYQLLPTTQIFVAKLRGQVIATLSLVIDGEMGMPIQSFFPDEINAARDRGETIGEVSCFADRRRDMKRFFTTFCKLTRLLAQYARSQSVHQLMVGARPRHARFYQRYMGFESMGSFNYPAVEDIPAVGLRLDFDTVETTRPQGYEAIFGTAIPDNELQTSKISGHELSYFKKFVEPSNRHDQASLISA